MKDKTKLLMPHVQRHPEVLDTLREIAAGKVSAEKGFERLRQIVDSYLPADAAEGHGELIGGLIFGVLILGKPGSLSSSDAEIWHRLINVPPSPLASARGVLEISILFGTAMDDRDVERGAHTLYENYLTKLFPSSPFLFKTKFSTVRNRNIL